MAFIPRGAIWYIAEVVLEITVEGATQNVVHINYLLVRAESPEDAYEKALRLGAEHETTYLNDDKKEVEIFFRGLRNLTIIYEPLEHGAELLYEEKLGLSKEAIDGLVQPRERLSVFKPIEKSLGPDYASAEILREARKLASG
jgi:hypothetical protein